MTNFRSIFPIFILLLAFFSYLPSPVLHAQELRKLKLQKIVIDPGHGGKDPGTISPSRKSLEKTICMDVALKLGTLINEHYPAVEVIYTRKTDIFIPLATRTDIANKNNADLFISIHVNSVKSTTPSGSETFIMGLHKSEENMELSKLENSVIIYEEDYSSKYAGFDPNAPESYIIFNLLQNAHLEQSLLLASLVQDAFGKAPITVNRGIKQAGLLVLWRSTMPAVLVELGFLSNTQDRQVLISSEGQDKLALAIFKAFEQYKNKYEQQQLQVTALKQATDTVGKQTDSLKETLIKESLTEYRVQIFAVTKLLKPTSREFKGLKNISHFKTDKLYKYTTGNFDTMEEAQARCRKLRKNFPQAFVVAVQNGIIISTP